MVPKYIWILNHKLEKFLRVLCLNLESCTRNINSKFWSSNDVHLFISDRRNMPSLNRMRRHTFRAKFREENKMTFWSLYFVFSLQRWSYKIVGDTNQTRILRKEKDLGKYLTCLMCKLINRSNWQYIHLYSGLTRSIRFVNIFWWAEPVKKVWLLYSSARSFRLNFSVDN